MDVLVALGERAGEVVTRDALLKRVWPGVAETDDAVSRTIFRLRQQMEAAGQDARY
jgi:DNA-binding winged helix-turn-helix (wHTH) protein